MYKVYYNINTIHVGSLNQIIMSEIVDNKKSYYTQKCVCIHRNQLRKKASQALRYGREVG